MVRELVPRRDKEILISLQRNLLLSKIDTRRVRWIGSRTEVPLGASWHHCHQEIRTSVANRKGLSEEIGHRFPGLVQRDESDRNGNCQDYERLRNM